MPDGKPNILVIWGDDIGISNLSCYSRGMMGYFTPNIDRIANEGMLFTDSYGEQSCTAGRSSFITGQSVYRTGMSKVGMPGVDIGLQKEDPTIAELLKPLGYATGQFGKNHLGDLNKYLPTVHGFDEFFGNLYHLNAEEEPEHEDYPTAEEAPLLRGALLPRGVIHSWATEEDSGEVDERYGPVGKQRIEDTGPLTKLRMETVDDETTGACADFIRRQHDGRTPFFVWMNMTHMHFRTHTKPESRGQAGRWQSPYHDTMIDHDRNVGTLLDLLDELGIAEDTIVIYSTDNGPHANSWPDGATTPFRSEKATNWEGAFRIPEMIRWPGKITPGSVSNDIVQHHDWLPTFLAAAGDPDTVDKLKAGHTAGDMTYKVHIDGYNLLPYLTGEVDKSPRRGLIYFSDDGDVLGIRAENWKIVFMEQRCQGTLQVWFEPFTALRAPKLFNLRTDPYEHADVTSNTYWDWLIDRIYLMFFGTAIVNQFLETFKEFPPRQEPASFTINNAVEELEKFLATGAGERAHLSSWKDGATKSAIIDFVARVTGEGPDFVEPEARVAVFDNDGTLWCEKPMYIQLDFIARRLADIAATDATVAGQEPYRAAAAGDLNWFGGAITKHYQGDDADLKVLARAVLSLHQAMEVEDHAALVNTFFAETTHPTLGRPYQKCVYAPMVELLRYLEAHAFTCYIVSGGGRDFMRPITGSIYGIPPERVVGSAQGLKFVGGSGVEAGHGDLLIQPALDVFDDGPEKPVRIWNRIGRRPIVSAGNSNGDDEMLVYSGRPGKPALRLVVLHDDSAREFDYTAGAERVLTHAGEFGWNVVSMKNDWATVFSD